MAPSLHLILFFCCLMSLIQRIQTASMIYQNGSLMAVAQNESNNLTATKWATSRTTTATVIHHSYTTVYVGTGCGGGLVVLLILYCMCKC